MKARYYCDFIGIIPTGQLLAAKAEMELMADQANSPAQRTDGFVLDPDSRGFFIAE